MKREIIAYHLKRLLGNQPKDIEKMKWRRKLEPYVEGYAAGFEARPNTNNYPLGCGAWIEYESSYAEGKADREVSK